LENKTAPTIRDMSGQFGAGLRYAFFLFLSIFQMATIREGGLHSNPANWAA
jgi:hypothetical protein